MCGSGKECLLIRSCCLKAAICTQNLFVKWASIFTLTIYFNKNGDESMCHPKIFDE